MTHMSPPTLNGAIPSAMYPGKNYPSEPIAIPLTEGESVFKDKGQSLDYDVPFRWAGH